MPQDAGKAPVTASPGSGTNISSSAPGTLEINTARPDVQMALAAGWTLPQISILRALTKGTLQEELAKQNEVQRELAKDVEALRSMVEDAHEGHDASQEDETIPEIVKSLDDAARATSRIMEELSARLEEIKAEVRSDLDTLSTRIDLAGKQADFAILGLKRRFETSEEELQNKLDVCNEQIDEAKKQGEFAMSSLQAFQALFAQELKVQSHQVKHLEELKADDMANTKQRVEVLEGAVAHLTSRLEDVGLDDFPGVKQRLRSIESAQVWTVEALRCQDPEFADRRGSISLPPTAAGMPEDVRQSRDEHAKLLQEGADKTGTSSWRCGTQPMPGAEEGGASIMPCPHERLLEEIRNSSEALSQGGAVDTAQLVAATVALTKEMRLQRQLVHDGGPSTDAPEGFAARLLHVDTPQTAWPLGASLSSDSIGLEPSRLADDGPAWPSAASPEATAPAVAAAAPLQQGAEGPQPSGDSLPPGAGELL